MIVILTEKEQRMLEWVGKQRLHYAKLNNLAPVGTATNNEDAKDHILGAQCEFATSIALNLFWRPNIGILNAVDVGGAVEVRSTPIRDGRLIIRPKDRQFPFVLAYRNLPQVELLGWQWADWAKKHCPLDGSHGPAAHYVQQKDLKPLKTLYRMFNA